MTDQPEPICKFEQGCHRVVPCDPGCGAAYPQPPVPARYRADTITDDQLDELYADAARSEEVIGELNEANVRLAKQAGRAEQAEAAIARIRAWAIHLHGIGNYRTAQDGLELLTLITGTPWHDLIDDRGQLLDDSYDPIARQQVTTLLTCGRALDDPKEPTP